jgi:alpha-L-fucosidase
MKHLHLAAILMLGFAPCISAATDPVHNADPASRNKPERLERFRDLGFGLFIHWNVDCQLGTVISHSLVGASDDYVNRYFTELPRTFNPHAFRPADWAALARLAGVKYVVLTAKHHAGFCLWDTKTTDFNVMNTPFKRDIVAETLDAFRAQGIAPGLYHSPDDFLWLWKNGITLQRSIPGVQPSQNPGLLKLDQDQIRELVTKYGAIDFLFLDGEAKGLREVAWDVQPELVVTRGAIRTPEQHVPGAAMDEPWESCITMGRGWGYQPTREEYKSGTECIRLLVETRAKGGNLLLNVGPKPDGTLPIEQEERLREIALWMFVNQECIHGVRPWVVTNERNIWFTRARATNALYAIIERTGPWPDGAARDFVLRSVRATPRTQISVLGMNGRVFEYQPKVDPAPVFAQKDDGLHVRIMPAQRIRETRDWPNPVVVKLTDVEPALDPPRVDTTRVTWNASAASCEGTLLSLGDAKSIKVGVEYRDITGLDTHDRPDTWTPGPLEKRDAPGPFTIEVATLKRGRTYELRAVAHHPLLYLYGRELTLKVP